MRYTFEGVGGQSVLTFAEGGAWAIEDPSGAVVVRGATVEQAWGTLVRATAEIGQLQAMRALLVAENQRLKRLLADMRSRPGMGD